MESTGIPEAAVGVYRLLAPLSPEDRLHAARAALAMFGETRLTSDDRSFESPTEPASEFSDGFRRLGPNARRWLKQNGLTLESISEVFDFEGSDVLLLTVNVPGATRKEQTANCYLLVGIWALLRGDEAAFSDERAVDYCKSVGAYDINNHTANRRAIGNRLSGDRKNGYRLTAPGLRDAASTIRALAQSPIIS